MQLTAAYRLGKASGWDRIGSSAAGPRQDRPPDRAAGGPPLPATVGAASIHGAGRGLTPRESAPLARGWPCPDRSPRPPGAFGAPPPASDTSRDRLPPRDTFGDPKD